MRTPDQIADSVAVGRGRPLDILPLLLVPTDDVPSLVPTTAVPSSPPLLCVRLNNHMSALRPPLRAAGHAIMEFFSELKKLLGRR